MSYYVKLWNTNNDFIQSFDNEIESFIDIKDDIVCSSIYNINKDRSGLIKIKTNDSAFKRYMFNWVEEENEIFERDIFYDYHRRVLVYEKETNELKAIFYQCLPSDTSESEVNIIFGFYNTIENLDFLEKNRLNYSLLKTDNKIMKICGLINNILEE